MAGLAKILRYLTNTKSRGLRKRIFFGLASIVVFVTTYTLILPAITASTNVYCGKTEHVHSESCYTEKEVLKCKKKEQKGHSHSDSCYKEVEELSCSLEECSGHTHDDSCYEEESVLTCTNEDADHEHDSSCYETSKKLVCGKEESSGHTHTADCYKKKKVLSCGKKETKGHTHTADCYKTKRNRTCKKKEHTHTLSCYSNPKADVETKKQWEKTLKDVELTGNWSEDVLTVAKSQLGYHESTQNYLVDEKGNKKGYSRYGDWYGNSYGDWCAMFVSFCIRYADISDDVIPINAGCQRWIEQLNRKSTPYYYAVNDDNDYKLVNKSKNFEPSVGNIIFFNWDSAPDSDHVGLVVAVKKDKDGKVEEIKTIEGNSSNQVQYKTYEASDPCIMGYAVIPENPDYEEEQEKTKESKKAKETKKETEEETKAETESETEAETETITLEETEGETQVETEGESTAKTEGESTVETEGESTVETEGETQAETESESTVETEHESAAAIGETSEDVVERESETTFEDESVSKSENESALESENETEPESESALESESGTESESESVLESESETESEVESESETAEENPAEQTNPFWELIERTYDGDDYHIILTYTKEAAIPDIAKLEVHEVTGTAYQERCEEAKEAMNLAEISFARFFDISFLIGDETLEPLAGVEVQIIYDEPITIAEKEISNAIHFAKDGTEVLPMEAEQSDEGTIFNFEQESFSVVGTVVGSEEETINESDSVVNATFDADAPNVGAVTGTHTTTPVVGEWYILYGYISGDAKYGPGQAIAASNPSDMVPLNQVSNDGGTVAYNGVMDLVWQYTENGFRNRNGEYLTITYYEANDTAQLGTSSVTTNANVKYNNNYHILYNTQVVDGNTIYNKIYMHENQGIIEGIMQDYLGTISSTAPPIYIARLTYDNSGSSGAGSSETDTADSNHPQCALTGTPDLENLILYSMYADDSGLLAVPGVVYTVYDSNGKIVTSLETTDSYGLFLGKLPAGDYTVKQTSVPEGYVVNPEVKSFTVNNDGYAFIGVFYVYKESPDDFVADKTAQVVDYVNRLYQVTLNSKSGSYKFDMEAINYSLVVDQSNSMLFPAELTETGKTVIFNEKSITASNGWFSGCYIDTSGNLLEAQDGRGNVYGYVTYDRINSRWVVSWRCKINGTHTTLYTQYSNKNRRGQDVIASLNTTVSGKTINHSQFTVGTINTTATNNGILESLNLDKKKVYYVIADETTTSTVYALWHNGEGWIYQDAAYYAKAQFTIAGLPNSTEGGGAVTYAQYNSGYSVGTAYGGGDIDTGLGGALLNDIKNGKTFTIYTGSQYNRLHELQQAVAAFATQLAALNENATLDLVTFDKEVESCYQDIQLNPDNVKTVIGYVNGITTSGGTRQEKALRHLIGTHGGNNSANHNRSHLSTDGMDVVILITDGAPVKSSGDSDIVTDDLIKAGDEIEAAGVDLTITVGLSMKNVQYGTQQLKGAATSEDWYFSSETTGELTDILVKNILFKLGKKTLLESKADIKDVISESFYITDKDGNALSAGTRINLNGNPDDNGPGLVCYDADKKEWYITWDNQTLGIGTAETETTTYVYKDDAGTETVIDPSTVYYINYWSSKSISGSGPDDSSQDRLVYQNGEWIYHWKTYNGDSARYDSVDGRVTSSTTAGSTASPEWRGNIYLKAKEDFIGGNTIDTNKEATVTLETENGTSAKKGINLPTPTVNVRLLEMQGFESEETVFLGDDITEIRKKLQTLLNKTVVEKIKESTGNQMNYKENSEEEDGCYATYFTIPYAIRDLTEEEWNQLFDGDPVKIEYTYDDDSSHGAVGYFTFTLKKEVVEGEPSEFNDHETKITGKDVETYTLTVTYTAYEIGERDSNNNLRKDNVHNGPNGPGTEVGKGPAGDIPHGAGTESVDEIHHVHVIDGEIYVTKVIDSTLINDEEDQEFTFALYVADPITGEPSSTSFREVTVTVAKGQTNGTIHIDHLPRNKYFLKEVALDGCEVDDVKVITGDTNCLYDEDDPSLEFDIGTNENSSGNNPDKNVIIYNKTLPSYENSVWEEEERYVYSKPFTSIPNTEGGSSGGDSSGDGSGSGDSGNGSTTPGTHLEAVEKTVYDCSSGSIISTSTTGSTYTIINATKAELDAVHSNYGILIQDADVEDSWTIEWHSWEKTSESTSTSFDWDSPTIITSDVSGSQYVKSNQTQAQLNESHTDYGILTQNFGDEDNWTIEWHRWSSEEKTTTTPGETTYQAVTIGYFQSNAPSLSQYANNGYYYYDKDSSSYELITAIRSDGYNIIITTPKRTNHYITNSDLTVSWINNANYIEYDIYKLTTTDATSSTTTIWTDTKSTERADSSMIPTTTTTTTNWSESIETDAADTSRIPTKTVTEYVEVPDETQESEADPDSGSNSESEEDVVAVTITKLSAGHGKIVNTKIKYEANLPVMKKWDDGGSHSRDTVYVVLYDKDGIPVTDANGQAQMLKLTADNGWVGNFTVSVSEENYNPLQDGYQIREVTDIQTTESDESIKAVVINDDNDNIIYYVKVAEENDFVIINNTTYNAHYLTEDETLVVKNNKSYELPKTGGVGTTLYTMSGIGLIISALVLYIFSLRHRQERRFY